MVTWVTGDWSVALEKGIANLRFEISKQIGGPFSDARTGTEKSLPFVYSFFTEIGRERNSQSVERARWAAPISSWFGLREHSAAADGRM